MEIQPNSTIVIIPAYQEERSIGGLVRSLRERYPYDVLVVNDGSTDGTSRRREGGGSDRAGPAVQPRDRRSRADRVPLRQGSRLRSSSCGSTGTGSTRSRTSPRSWSRSWRARADAVIGSRFLGETEYRGSIPRIFGIRFFRFLVNLTTGYRVTDPTSGFFAINRRLVEFYSDHYPSDYPEVDAYILMHRLKARTVEVPVRMYDRAEGKSSITAFRAVYYMVKVTLSFLINCIRRFG